MDHSLDVQLFQIHVVPDCFCNHYLVDSSAVLLDGTDSLCCCCHDRHSNHLQSTALERKSPQRPSKDQCYSRTLSMPANCLPYPSFYHKTTKMMNHTPNHYYTEFVFDAVAPVLSSAPPPSGIIVPLPPPLQYISIPDRIHIVERDQRAPDMPLQSVENETSPPPQSYCSSTPYPDDTAELAYDRLS